MSLEAFIWAANLPMNAMSLAERCVLGKLANHAHSDGTNAFRSTQSLADELHVTRRTVQRAQATLRDRGLIREGDQALVSHIRADRRPTVYDLDLRWTGDNLVTPYDGVTDEPRDDGAGSDGATAAVAQGTVIEPLTKTLVGNQTGLVTPSRCTGSKSGLHRYEDSSWCVNACGTRRDDA